MLTVNPQVMDVKSVQEFIDTVKANPGKYNYASTGNGTGTHLAFAELVSRAGLDMVHVPYKGGPEALASVVSGQTCCIMNQVQTVHDRSGRPAACACSASPPPSASPSVPDIPTIAEAGVPGYESYIWFGLFGPKGLDAQIVEPRQRRGEGRARDARGARAPGAARQHAALGDARAVPRNGEGRPRPLGERSSSRWARRSIDGSFAVLERLWIQQTTEVAV